MSRDRALPPISMVMVSHNHYDHCDLRTLATLAERFDWWRGRIQPIGS